MKYTARYFKDNLPEWKRKKDSVLVRNILRPISFYFSSFAANHNISANQVSFLSMIVAVVAAAFFLIANSAFHIVGGLFLFLWMILDCTDGNLARSVKQQNYGEFADGMSGYLLINLLFICLGMCVYNEGGLLVLQNNPWMIFLGALTASFDSLSRLANQKFINTEHELIVQGKLKNEEGKSDLLHESKWAKIFFRIMREANLNGLFLPLILLASIFNFIDIIVILYSLEYFLMFAGTLFSLIRKVLRENKKEEHK